MLHGRIASARRISESTSLQSFAPNRADEALDMAVLTRRARRDRVIADSHGPNAMGVGWTKGAVTVTQQVTRRLVPRKGVSHLNGEPRGARIARHADAHQPPARVTQDHQAVEQLEGDGTHHEKIQRRDGASVIAQESLPTLRRWSAAPDHIPAQS